MPDFTVEIRNEPRDVKRGLIVDLEPDDKYDPLGNDPSPGVWPNRANSANPALQSDAGKRPEAVSDGSNQWFEFDGSDDFLKFDVDLTGSAGDLTFAFQAKPDVDTGTGMYFFDGDGTPFPLQLAQLSNVSGQLGFNDGSWHTAGSATSSTDEQSLVWTFEGSAGRLYRDGTLIINDTYSALAIDGSPNIVIGARSDGLANFYDGKLGNILAWNRALTAREKQLIFARLPERYGILPYSADTRSTAVVQSWLDPAGTGPGGSSQPSRINARSGLPLRRYVATTGYLQLAAVVGGVQGPPDSALGGNLFLWDVIEAPVAYPVPILQDFGYTSIADVRLDVAGHYTIQALHAGGGSVLVHVDVV